MTSHTGCPATAQHQTATRPVETPLSTTPPPIYDADLFSAAAIRDAYDHYRRLRQMGPIVWSSAHGVFVASRYAEVRHILDDDTTFRSRTGITHVRLASFTGNGTTLTSDGERHAHRRKLVTKHLTPRSLIPRREEISAVADALVETAVERGEIDGVDDLALPMPLTIVPDLVGWPDRGRDKLLQRGIAGFDYAGPPNRLFLASLPHVIAMRLYVSSVVRRGQVRPGGAAAELVAAMKAGQLSRGEVSGMLIDLLAPSIDTTASIIAAALQLFADHPDQWELLRQDRTLLPGAINEIVRLASPLRTFTRRVHSDTVLAGHLLPAGSKIMVIYASANRDELVWDEPDAFDITRDATGHLGFGYGVHSCAGQGLGRMETTAVLSALLDRVQRIERRGHGERATNNIIYRWEKLPLRLIT